MGRKKSIERRIAGKSLAGVRQELRQIEQSIISDSVREAGQMAIEVFREEPYHPVFIDFPEFGEKVAELAEVVGGGKRPQVNRKKEPQSKTNLKMRNEKPEAEKPENKVGRFVANIPDEDL